MGDCEILGFCWSVADILALLWCCVVCVGGLLGNQLPTKTVQASEKSKDLNGGCFFIIKPTRCTNFTNLFWHETLHVSDRSSAHHHEFIHRALSNGICHTALE